MPCVHGYLTGTHASMSRQLFRGYLGNRKIHSINVLGSFTRAKKSVVGDAARRRHPTTLKKNAAA